MPLKITELTQASDGAKNQLVAMVEDPSGTPVTKKMQFNDLVNPGMGGLYWSTASATTITTASTYYLAAGTTTALVQRNFTASSAGRLTYDGTNDCQGLIQANLSLTGTMNISSWTVALAKNGTVVASNASRVNTTPKASGTDYRHVSLLYTDTLSTNDYYEIYLTASSSASTITVQYGQFIITTTWGT